MRRKITRKFHPSQSRRRSLMIELLEHRALLAGDLAPLLDINTSLSHLSLDPTNIVEAGGIVYFISRTETAGRELWKSDGTAAGTVLLKDIRNGKGDSGPTELTNVNGTLYFNAYDGFGYDLWKSDGTPSGTVKVKPGVRGRYLTDVNGTLFFSAINGEGGTELWKSDGTADGTVQVKEINAEKNTFSTEFVNVNGTLYFAANDGTAGYELWKSDGTENGTVLVDDIRSGSEGSFPGDLMNVDGTLFFTAHSTNGRELWKSDGSTSGTVKLREFFPANGRYYFTAVNDTLFFSNNYTTERIQDLWRSDGTVSGTIPLTQFNFEEPGRLTALVNVNGTLFFQANGLWKSDGTKSGTVQVSPGVVGSNLVNVNGTLFFGTNSLSKTDGTSSGTTLLKSGLSSASNFVNANGTLFFKANGELWKSDGTTAGTVQVNSDVAATKDSNPRYLTKVNDTLFFVANSSTSKHALWKSDGTASGTVLVKDIALGNGSPAIYGLANVNGTLFFSAQDGAGGFHLWKSDGTTAGTVQVSRAHARHLTEVNGTLYFVDNQSQGFGLALWKSDGSASGTVMVKDIDLTINSMDSYPKYLTNVNGTLFLSATDIAGKAELWKSDGTEAGTVKVKDTSAGGTFPNNLTVVNGILFFSATASQGGVALWKSDGTATGTVQVKDGFSPNTLFDLNNLTNVNGTLYFRGNDGTSGYELWKSDGTEAGTVQVKDIFAGISGSNPQNLTNVNGQLFFTSNDGTSGFELWTSDGTAAGTVQVKDIFAGNFNSFIRNLANVNGTLFFSASDGVSGLELWKSDGTANGTVQVMDIASAGESNPSNLTLVGNKLFFSALTNIYGLELYVINAPYTRLSSFSVEENTASDTILATLTSALADTGPVSYQLVPGAVDNAMFSIVDDELVLKVPADFESKSTLSIRIRTTDSTNQSFDETFAIKVQNLPEAPTAGLDVYEVPINYLRDADDADGDSTTDDGDNGVLANDYDSDGDDFALELITPPAKGTLTFNADGTFRYKPAANAVIGQVETFTYRLTDTTGRSSESTVELLISGRVDSPIHNHATPTDVNPGTLPGTISSLDALAIFNLLNGNRGRTSIPIDEISQAAGYFYDVNNDFFVSSLDVLVVINYLNARSRGLVGEGAINETLTTDTTEVIPQLSSDLHDAVFIDLEDLAKKRRF